MEIEEIPAGDFEALASVHPDGTPPKLSARLYEFFFTNFAQHNTCVHHGINIGEQYRQQCKHFTFFRRKPEVIFGIRPIDVACTPLKVTKGQLALFRWIHDNDVHNYIVLHEDRIKGAMQDFKKIPRSHISHESETLDNLTSRFSTMTVQAAEAKEDAVRLGVPRNRRFHNREVVSQKRATTSSHLPMQTAHGTGPPDERKLQRDQERRAEQLELQRLADLKRFERQQQELHDKQQRLLQKQIEKEAAKEAKKQLQTDSKGVRRSTRKTKESQQDDQAEAPAQWLYPATPTDSQFRRRLGW